MIRFAASENKEKSDFSFLISIIRTPVRLDHFFRKVCHVLTALISSGENGRAFRRFASPFPFSAYSVVMTVTTDAKRFAGKVSRLLRKHYPDAKCSLDFRSPLELVVATILSAQCTDERVNKVTPALFKQYPTAKAYAVAPIADLEKAIQSTGFFRNKAKNIQGCCRLLVERHGGKIPQDLESLVELPGVGRKTANVVLGNAYEIASGFVVDTHVTRISRRLGLTKQKDAEKIERDLIALFPKKEWIDLSHRIIQHGRTICDARKPLCDECPLNEICPRIDVKK